MHRVPTWLIGLLLIGLGAFCLVKWPDIGLLDALGEGVLVAGILVVAVDPFLKARLLREAAKGIFEHLLGFDQQPEIKDRLKKLVFTTREFRKDFSLRCQLAPLDEEMCLYLEYQFELINPTNETISYRNRLAFEPSESPKIIEMSLTTSSGKNNYVEVPELAMKPDEPPVLEASGPLVSVSPSGHGTRYFFSGKYRVAIPMDFYFSLHFTDPTIGFSLLMDIPSEYTVTASKPTSQVSNKWMYQRLFMPGEHICIRWRWHPQSALLRRQQ